MISNEKEETLNNGTSNIRKLLDYSFQEAKRLLVLAYNDSNANGRVEADSYQKYFLPRVNIENYNIEIDSRNFYDHPINDLSGFMVWSLNLRYTQNLHWLYFSSGDFCMFSK